MRALIALMMVAVLFAGCAEGAEPVQSDDAPEVEVSSTTGGIRGVVVDDSITPLEGAEVYLPNTGESTTSDPSGGFAFSNLEPGVYFVKVSKFGYGDMQSSVEVEAGVEKPPAVRIQLPKLDIGEPMDETVKFDGFYECAFSMWFITDSCDFGVRTVSDAGVPIPRGIQNNVNTAYYGMDPTTMTLIQEGFWDTSALPKFRASIADTPIDNLCDCSPVYAEAISDTGYTYARLDESAGSWPTLERDYAVRGFIPFADEATEVNYALNVKFEIFTTAFSNYEPQEGWNMDERDLFPPPS